ncbi:MAG: hypothetical protein EOP19_26060, partial [Hyphomicrobiales bacterium]
MGDGRDGTSPRRARPRLAGRYGREHLHDPRHPSAAGGCPPADHQPRPRRDLALLAAAGGGARLRDGCAWPAAGNRDRGVCLIALSDVMRCQKSNGQVETIPMLLDRRALLLAGLTLPTLAKAQSAWKPERPVRLILPFTAGTSMDPVARLAQESLKDTLGQSVVVENIAGAATVIAGAETLKSPPDGHTMLMIANSFAANITLRTRTADWQRAFVPVVQATVVPHVLTVAPAPKVDWAGFLKRLREGGGSMTYGSPGIGTSPHLGAEHFLRLVGGKAVHAPYNGTSQLFIDLYAGRID